MGEWADAVYLSADAEWNLEDRLLGRATYTTLRPTLPLPTHDPLEPVVVVAELLVAGDGGGERVGEPVTIGPIEVAPSLGEGIAPEFAAAYFGFFWTITPSMLAIAKST